MKIVKSAVTVMLIFLFAISIAFARRDKIEKLIEQLGSGDMDALFEAVNELSNMGMTAVDPLIYELKDRDSPYRWGAARTLGTIGDSRAVEALVDVISDRKEQWPLKYEALHALGNIRGERAFESLIDALNNEDFMVRAKAAETLGNIGDRNAVQPLIKTLKDGNWMVERYTAEALGTLGDARAIGPLVDFLSEKGLKARWVVFQALEDIGNLRSLELPLIDLLSSKENSIRFDAAELLRGLNWKPKSVHDRVAFYIAVQDWSMCIDMGSHAVEQLTELLDTPDAEMRMRLVQTLQDIGDPSAISSLVQALPDWSAGASIARALRGLGWTPESTVDRVHILIAEREIDTLRNMRDQSKEVLTMDLHSESIGTVQNALNAFIAMFGQDAITELTDLLNETGNETMACAFYQSGDEKLEEAGAEWLEISENNDVEEPCMDP